MRVSALKALRAAFSGGQSRRFPSADEDRCAGGLLAPAGRAAFRLEPGQCVFTLGSCFAREVEAHLPQFDLPCTRFSVPASEWPHRPNGLLNEYSPAAMAQRITWALDGTNTAALHGSFDGDVGARVRDLLLPGGAAVTGARALDRRREIDRIYAALPGADALIVTLGLVEVWRDEAAGQWLNQMPPVPRIRAEPARYSFHRLPPAACVQALAPALDGLIENGLSRIILTVSPVPLQSTFSGQDCVTANSYSKSALRVAAEELTKRFVPYVDYFPSYEMVGSLGLGAFCEDLVHVRRPVVARIVEAMGARYAIADTAPGTGAAGKAVA